MWHFRVSEDMWKLKLQQLWPAIVLVSIGLFLFTVQPWCRLMGPPSMADVRELAERAPLVFRGHILTVTPISSNSEPGARTESVARIQIDRWYRGKGSTDGLLRFAYGGYAANGHDCIDFRPDTYWVLFAAEKSGPLQLVDDCEGALSISPLLSPDLGHTDWLAQMEADFLAGLDDHDPALRLASIQRLGGLKLASSRDALHRVIQKGDYPESKWAVYATLRTGDVSVLPEVKGLLANGDREMPELAIAMELQNIADPSAVPELIAILDSARSELTRTQVLIALGEKMKDARAVPALATHLSDSDLHARYDALDGLKNITHEEACTLSPDWNEQDVEPQISRCKIWWEQIGKFRNWSQN